MNNKQLVRPFLLNERISYAILAVLFMVRFVDVSLPGWIFGANIPPWFAYWYVGLAYILTVLIVWLNRHRLSTLNIDRPFLIAVMLGGVLYVFYLTTDIGILVGITTLLVFWAYRNGHFSIKDPARYSHGTVLLILVSVLPVLLYILRYGHTLHSDITYQAIIASLLQAQLAAVVFEEVIFRGVLWVVFRNLGFKEFASFILSSLLFWIAHYRYLLQGNGYSFWFALPLVAFLFGFLAWRTKSLTPSTAGHFLFNFTVAMLRYVI